MPEGDRPEITFSKFQTIEDISGERYIILDRTVRVDGQSLDSLLNKIESLNPATSNSSFAPGRNELDRFRLLAFGYH